MDLSRRAFLGAAAAAAVPAQQVAIIDIHQHVPYSGRPGDVLVKHQATMGILKSVLLPAGREHGLEAAVLPFDAAYQLQQQHPDKFVCFANEVPYHPEFRATVEKQLKMGAIGIGEQKFFVDVQSKTMFDLCDVAQDFGVPVLLHFQHERYNVNYGDFWRVLAKYPKVNFIGHAQTFWGNVDAKQIQDVMYPRWKVTAGGWTDRYLRDYPNMFADMSAGSGLNALRRDMDHARGFVERHQDKLIYGSDCSDHIGQGEKCSGSQQIATIRELAPPAVQRKIFHDNAKRVMKI